MQLKDYTPRNIGFVELYQAEDWQLKVYSILYQGKMLNSALLDVAKQKALSFLPQPAIMPNHYGVGFLSVHQGESYDFVTVAFWTYGTELRFQTYMRPSSVSNELEPLSASELASDVWDIRLLSFERDAWVDCVLQTKGSAGLSAYLNKQLNERI